MDEKPLVSFDAAIKYLLKNKGDFQIIEGFISALLKAFGYSAVKIKALLDSESNKEQDKLKRSIADLVVEDEQDNKYIVEIDRAYTSTFLYKACFNTSRLVVNSLSAQENYSTIKKIFHVNLLYFVPKNMEQPLYHGKTLFKGLGDSGPVDIHISDLGGRIFDAHHVLPEYFVISIPSFNDVIKQEIDEWLYVMKHSAVREDFHSPYMSQVADRLSVLKLTSEERALYYQERFAAFKARDYLTSAEERGREEGMQKGIKKGMQKGIKKGREEGREEGMQKGIEKGREEEKLAIASNILSKGYTHEEVQALTGLSMSQIAQLAQETT